MDGPRIEDRQDPVLRTGNRHLWRICREPGCRARVRFEHRCQEHRDPDVSTVKFCEAEDCRDTLHRSNPRDYCGPQDHLGGPHHEIWWAPQAQA